MSPLLIAIDQGNFPIVELCTQSPQVEDKANKEGKTALILAVEKEDTQILGALLHEDVIERMGTNIDHLDVSYNAHLQHCEWSTNYFYREWAAQLFMWLWKMATWK
jgi:ankyrin repeat protein